LDITECVGSDQKQSTATTTSIMLETMRATDPWVLFLYALKAPATRDKYIQRITKFLDFLGYAGTKEEKARAFAAQAKADPPLAFNSVLKFFQNKREQIDRKEIAIGTVRNYLKSIKLFCDMPDLQIPWAKIAEVCQEQRGLQMIQPCYKKVCSTQNKNP
jgi:hypothetical protein